MDDFPQFMKDIAKEPGFYKGAERLLHVESANEIKDPVFSVLQERFDHHLSKGYKTIPGAQAAEPGRLATRAPVDQSTTSFRQFSAVGPLLAIAEYQGNLARKNPPAGAPLMIATNVVVERFEVEPENDPTHAHVLYTSRGPLTLWDGKTNVILATSAIPATTILLNSIDKKLQDRAGQRLTAHLCSSIVARFKPDSDWLKPETPLPSHLVTSACHVRGRASNNFQWHIQVNGIHEPVGFHGGFLDADEMAEAAHKELLDLAACHTAVPTVTQLKNSDGYIIVCASHLSFQLLTVNLTKRNRTACPGLSELPADTDSWVKPNNSDPDVTKNVRIQLDLSHSTMTVRDEMEKAMYDSGVLAQPVN